MEEQGFSLKVEGKFLGTVQEGVTERIKKASPAAFCQMAALLALTSAVGLGYGYRTLSSLFRT
jgi:hypothetical protein